MTLTRRKLILGGTAGLVVVAGGAAAPVLTRAPKTARAPWMAAGQGFGDIRLDAFSYGVLAPNPHNRQPWLVELIGDTEAMLYCQLDRRLPQTDPYDRQITIGLGCFAELASLAAAQRGFHLTVTPFPDGAPQPRLDKRPVAHFRFTRDAYPVPQPLAGAIPHRRSTKEVFSTRPVRDATVQAMFKTANVQGGFTTQPDAVAALRDLTWQAHQIEVLTPRTNMESVDLMRIGAREVDANPDGIDLQGPMMEMLAVTGVMTRDALADPASTAFQEGLKLYQAFMQSAQAHAWLATPGNGRTDQFAAGRAYARLNLVAAIQGVAMHPLSQALQEYPEMEGLYKKLHKQVGVAEPGRIQMLVRLGYADAPTASPRWPLETRLVAA